MFNGKKILLCVTGGIAVYKAVGLASRFKKLGGEVHVIMSKNATEFVSPLTFKTITGNKVTVIMFDHSDFVPHISYTEMAEIVIVAPATANIIAKAACGIADDMISTLLLSVKCPVIFIPAMNTRMYLNPIVQENIFKIKKSGFMVMEPETGRMACDTEGVGRFPEIDSVVDFITNSLETACDGYYKSKKALITLGGTIEDIDPVRSITNRSSGRMGFAFADELIKNGADVRVIAGNCDKVVLNEFCRKFPFVDIVNIRSHFDLKTALEKYQGTYDLLVMAAAVSDYTPVYSKDKVKKTVNERYTIELIQTEDLLKSIQKTKGVIYVGFAAETEDPVVNARKKIESKGVDFIIANKVSGDESAMGGDKAGVTVLSRFSEILYNIDYCSKSEVAASVLSYIASEYPASEQDR